MTENNSTTMNMNGCFADATTALAAVVGVAGSASAIYWHVLWPLVALGVPAIEVFGRVVITRVRTRAETEQNHDRQLTEQRHWDNDLVATAINNGWKLTDILQLQSAREPPAGIEPSPQSERATPTPRSDVERDELSRS